MLASSGSGAEDEPSPLQTCVKSSALRIMCDYDLELDRQLVKMIEIASCRIADWFG